MRAVRGTRPAVNDSVQPPGIISAANDTNLLNPVALRDSLKIVPETLATPWAPLRALYFC